ncbi:uncharacterized protein LOC108162523 [Drosophila miranda]|uniref:uncharacterized protein LOC108162523 n=1 Tax=Drosophila miranda TaxID=7229 RepID=UPI0007E8348E|nr:uncharacterized protein LOC108162523 [Drosophila miranda]XP_017152794.1 uncharacterized protein LOC108162523 [Drosophila miranda]
MRSCCSVLCLLLVTVAVLHPSEARGGRGRGGGSFGGLFGGWRKYKKPSSSGGGRRVVSGSPVHTAMTVPKPPPPPPAPPKAMMPPKQQIPSYPRQQMPAGYNYPTHPGQGTYYSNAQSLPAGAVYYAQPPMSMSRGSGTGDFLTGMLAGHMMNNMLFGHRHHVYHRNREGEDQIAQTAQGNGRQIIIINNGQPEEAALNETTISEEAGAAVAPENPLTEEEESSSATSSEESADVEGTALPTPGAIVCFPITLNETDPEQPDLMREVERVVCFPAPSNPEAGDLLDGPEQGSTTTTDPPVVAGEIGADAGGASEGNTEGNEASEPVEVASYVAGRAASVDVDALM